ncbi:MAG: hypothetical protein GF311_15350 [Candidatus Lokiarchaeota archaeon]|nr:hypothetical protein [Candidatus Lokiarchaeota archaeon]
MVDLNWDDKERLEESISKIQDNLRSFERMELNSKPKYDLLVNANDKDWINKLYWGDNLQVALYLLPKFREQIDLLYLDPPFFSGTNYQIQILEGNKEFETLAYHDKWQDGLDVYLNTIYQQFYVFKKLLSPQGLIFVHVDWHANHYIRAILDELFGINNFVNSIVWYYYNKYSAGKYNLPRAHDIIFVYSKSDEYTFNELRIPRKKPIKQLKRVMVNGTLKNAKDENGNLIYRIVKDKKMDDVWRIPCMQPASKQWTGYPTQKHHRLLERIIKIGTNEGDLVADFYCGSGTTLYAAEKLKRRWIGTDNSKYAIYLTRNRLLNYLHKKNVNNLYPFEIVTSISEERQEILNSDFFQKELIIKRKK